MAIETINAIGDSTLFDSEDYYSLSDHDSYFTKDNLFSGKQGEQIILSASKTKFKTKDGYRIEHNTFGSQYEYSCGHGVDLKIFERCKKLAEIECKNLAWQNKPYGTDFVRKKILPRFSHSGDSAKLLIITFMALLTKLAVQLLEQEGIIIIEVGERLTSQFYRGLKKLYVLGNRIHNAITNFWSRKVQPKSRPFFAVGVNAVVNPLVNYTVPIVSNNEQQIVKQHDTVHSNYTKLLIETEQEARKLYLRELDRLRKLHGKTT